MSKLFQKRYIIFKRNTNNVILMKIQDFSFQMFDYKDIYYVKYSEN